ncbi:MAG: hypothetical protein ACREPL_03755 [Rhodanobacteraceae bacterium]
MTDDDKQRALQHLAQKVASAREAWQAEISAAFDELHQLDPELVTEVVQVFGRKMGAINYLANKQIDYEEPDCYAALAAGKRERILYVIRALASGNLI